MDLRTRYTALVTLTTQHVKYISDALRRLEEEEVGSAAALVLIHRQVSVSESVRLMMTVLSAERGGGGEAGPGGPGVRPAGLGGRAAGPISRTQR